MAFAAQVDLEMAEAITMRESHQQVADMKLRRGSFKGTIMGHAEGHMTFRGKKRARRKGKGKGSRGGGKSKGKGDQKLKPGGQQTLLDTKAGTCCAPCGQLGHWRGDPSCPMSGQSTLDQHGLGATRRRRYALASMFGYVAHTHPLPSVLQEAFLSFQSGHSIADTGCTKSVAGTLWLEDIERRLAVFDLKPLKATRDGISCRCVWQTLYCVVAGNMPGLTARQDLARWGPRCVLRVAAKILKSWTCGISRSKRTRSTWSSICLIMIRCSINFARDPL